MKSCALSSLFIFFLSSVVHADSSCWPEEKLIGTSFIGYIPAINYTEFFKSDAAAGNTVSKGQKNCEVELFKDPLDKNFSKISCKQIQCIKGECGDDGDHTTLPVHEKKNHYVKIVLKDKKEGWIKVSNMTEVQFVLPLGKIGTLFPTSTPILDAPRGKTIKVESKKKMAYTLKKIVKAHEEEWAYVEINPIISEEPPVQVGPAQAQGYFLHRDREQQLRAVLSDIWCD